MKILIVTQHYWPENFRITDIAEELVKRGHEIVVLTGLPNYPQGYIYADYKNKKNRKQFHNGVKIIRVKEIGRRNNILFRFLNYYSYPYFAKMMIKKIDKDFDVVFINGLSPIMSAEPAILYKKKYGAKLIMYEMDLWPESLTAGGIKKTSLIYKYYRRISNRIYSYMDEILVSTLEHEKYLKNLTGSFCPKITYLPQYAETIFNEQKNLMENLNDKTLNIMFAGNIGKAQSIDTIINAANLLKDSNVKFHIVGDGSELKNIKNLVESLKLPNVIFYGQQKLTDMPKLYRLANIMLVTLSKDTYANYTLPGKVQTYLACGMPIFGAADGATNKLINDNKCGVCVASGDFISLSKAIKNVKRDQLIYYSKNSLDLYNKFFTKEKFFKVLLAKLKECCK